jgi:hypothetical protein
MVSNLHTMLLSILFIVTVSAELYCPSEQDMNKECTDCNVNFADGGWSMKGGGRVSSKTSFNLLGGYMEFDMDTTGVANEVNTNFYTSSPSKQNCGSACYCDIQKSSSGKPSCMEMDIIEANGNCAMATTIHTFAKDGTPNNADCDRWGCGSGMNLPKTKFHIKAQFAMDGNLTVYLNGVANDHYNIVPSSDSNQVVVTTMQSIGAVIESSQWFGWAPSQSSCPTGSQDGLPNSHFVISNVKVMGAVVQGPQPTKCAEQPTPAPPAPTPQPPTPPAPAPSGCPGGSLATCIGLCPSNPPAAYQACVESCVSRCS